MKVNVNFVVPILWMAATTVVVAQPTASYPFWVVEGNIRQADYTIIRFFDAHHSLMKEEKLTGAFLDIRKKRNQRLLENKLKDQLNAQFQVVAGRRKGKKFTKW